MLRRLKNMLTYEYAVQNRKNLVLNLLLTVGQSVVVDVAFLAGCFLILLLI